ncbi:MAG: thiamine pyrophosphate-binding protein [Pyrinomonadaceae bacterium]
MSEHAPDTGYLYQDFKSQGYDFFVGVPCSFLKGFICEMEADTTTEFIPATREDVALSIAVGAYFAGKKPLVYIQSSGLGHLVNAITSLLTPYDIPVHILVSLRRAPFEHFEMYRISRDLLQLMNYDNYTIVEEAEPK